MSGDNCSATIGAIAVTGSIGSGKSTVLHWLGQHLAIPVYSADDEVKELLVPGGAGWLQLRRLLADEYFDHSGQLKKPVLREAIFSDSSLRENVERVIHPLVLASLRHKTAAFTKSCVVEVPLLFEAGWQCHFHLVLVVYAEETLCLRRIIERDKISMEQAKAALLTQMSIQEKIAQANFSVDNNGPWSSTVSQLQEFIKLVPRIQKKTLDTLC